MCLYLADKGVVGVFYWNGGVCFGRKFPCIGEFNVVMRGGGFNGICVYVCVNYGF